MFSCIVWASPCTIPLVDGVAYPPPGCFVDIGGYSLHIHKSGSGNKTVILDAGLGGFSEAWSQIQPEVATFAKVVSFDRAGTGWSDASSLPRTSLQIAEELHILLEKAQIPPPYILVGHSFGGNTVQLYATLYPDEVEGLVLVDSSHESQEGKLPDHPLGDIVMSTRRVEDLPFIETYGMRCFATQVYLKAMFSSLPKTMQDLLFSLLFTRKHCYTLKQEAEAFPTSLEQLAKADRSVIQDKPCFVISAGRETDLSKFVLSDHQYELLHHKALVWYQAWTLLQQDLVRKFTRSVHLIATKSDHMIPMIEPELVIFAIRQLVEGKIDRS